VTTPAIPSPEEQITGLRKTVSLLAVRNGELHVAMRNLLTAPNDPKVRKAAESLLLGGPWSEHNE